MDELSLEMCSRVAGNSDVVQIARVDAGRRKAVAHSVAGKARTVLNPGEPLLLNGSDELAVTEKSGGCIGVIAIDSQNVHRLDILSVMAHCGYGLNHWQRRDAVILARRTEKLHHTVRRIQAARVCT